MNPFERFLQKKFVEKNADALFSAMQQANGSSDAEDIDALVDAYFHLLKAVYRGPKPIYVSLSKKEPYLLIIDGVSYDLDALTHHNDLKNTERKMQLDLLFSADTPVQEVEARLMQRIKSE